MKKYKKESRINRHTAPLLQFIIFGAQLILALLLWSPIRAQATQQPDPWEPLKYFVGSWEGMAKGQTGNGKVEREYQFVLISTRWTGRRAMIRRSSSSPKASRTFPRAGAQERSTVF